MTTYEICKKYGKKGVTERSMPPIENISGQGQRWKECRYCKNQEDTK